MTALTSGDGISDLIRDERFYMKTVIFLAGRTLFKPPVYALPKEEGVFSAMFELPNTTGEGSSDENPIRLPPEVTAEDFHCFLEACFPKPEWEKPSKLGVDGWMRVLKLATMWNLDALRNKAISSADKEISALISSGEIGVVDKIVLSKEYRVSRWLLDGYETLGNREARLTSDERNHLGMESALRGWYLREEYWTWSRGKARAPRAHLHESGGWGSSDASGWDSASRDMNTFNFRSAIRSIFAEELSLNPDYADAASSIGGSWDESRIVAGWGNDILETTSGRTRGQKRTRVDASSW